MPTLTAVGAFAIPCTILNTLVPKHSGCIATGVFPGFLFALWATSFVVAATTAVTTVNCSIITHFDSPLKGLCVPQLSRLIIAKIGSFVKRFFYPCDFKGLSPAATNLYLEL